MKNDSFRFQERQKQIQIDWWKNYSNQPNWSEKKNKSNWGKWGGEPYEHIISHENWEELLWGELKKSGILAKYLKKNKIQKHSGVSNLLSSWITCANLYFPTREFPDFKDLMLAFLKEKISNNITKITNVELEFSFEDDLSPSSLLGEEGGTNGMGQTSPDVAFLVETNHGKGVILTECKYTEHSFYKCSARRKTDRDDKKGNPHPEKCLKAATTRDYKTIPCHQTVWGRKYLDYFEISDYGKKVLSRCPAATSGYQLMRQQALANGIKEKGHFDLVVSAVSFDKRNVTLINSLKTTGIPDFQSEWTMIYNHGAEFISWYHQDWVDFVRKSKPASIDIKDWLQYMNKRYGY